MTRILIVCSYPCHPRNPRLIPLCPSIRFHVPQCDGKCGVVFERDRVRGAVDADFPGDGSFTFAFAFGVQPQFDNAEGIFRSRPARRLPGTIPVAQPPIGAEDDAFSAVRLSKTVGISQGISCAFRGPQIPHAIRGLESRCQSFLGSIGDRGRGDDSTGSRSSACATGSSRCCWRCRGRWSSVSLGCGSSSTTSSASASPARSTATSPSGPRCRRDQIPRVDKGTASGIRGPGQHVDSNRRRAAIEIGRLRSKTQDRWSRSLRKTETKADNGDSEDRLNGVPGKHGLGV
jgi:hypothetical protein